MDVILESRDLKKQYMMGQNVVRALDGVSLDIERGEFIGLIGTSGSGKSTLLNLIGGLDHPTEGSLKIFGQELSRLSRDELSAHRQKNVGMIFQSFNLVPTMSALENVSLALIFAGVPRARREQRSRELLNSVGLAEREIHKPAEMSGGEQQRVSIARALANNPEILLADEPTGNLDSKTAREILDLLASLNQKEHKTVVLVSHDQTLASAYVRRTVTLMDGKIISDARL